MTPFEPNLSSLAVARDVLLTPFGLDEGKLITTLGTMFTHKVDYADLYFQFTKSEGWSLEEGIVKSGSFSIDQGVGVRAVSGDKTAFAYSDEISQAALLDAAAATRTIARAGAGRVKVAANVQPSGGRSLYLPHDPLASLDATAKVALLERVEKIARAKDPRVVQVMAGLAGEYDVVLVVRSDGVLAADIRPLVRVSVTVIAEQNGRREMGSSGGGGRYDYAYFSDELLEKYASEAVQSALVNLEARPAPAGPMTIVLGPGWPGVLLHEAVGHGLEGDFNRKGTSAFSGKMGQQVAARGVTIVDDGTIPDARGSLNIDDEGTATACTTLIEDGVLVGYMHDRLSARQMGVKTTGNGRRQSYAHQPLPRMTNTFMRGGKDKLADMIANTKRGLYAVNFGGGQVDITNGKFVFQCTEAYLIEDGRIGKAVKGATLIGDGPAAMRQVDMIGDDFRFDPGVGTCGKAGQSVPVGIGQPSLRIRGLTVGGTN